MSLTRKFLSAMGIEDDKAEQIITAHLETVSPLKQERDDYKTKAEQLPDIQKKLDAANAKLAEFNDDSKDSWKVKYDALVEEKKKLQKSFDDYKAEVDNKELSAKKAEAYKKLLKDAGVSEKRFDAIMKVTNLDDKKMDENGSLEDSEAILKAIKTEWADFIGTTQTHGADVSNPPENNGGNTGVNTRAAEIAKAHYARIYGTNAEENK